MFRRLSLITATTNRSHQLVKALFQYVTQGARFLLSCLGLSADPSTGQSDELLYGHLLTSGRAGQSRIRVDGKEGVWH